MENIRLTLVVSKGNVKPRECVTDLWRVIISRIVLENRGKRLQTNRKVPLDTIKRKFHALIASELPLINNWKLKVLPKFGIY